MSDNKLECTDSYILPQGPKGDVGPNGSQGQQGTSPATGPTGAIGLSGRSKIDISFSDGTNPYRESHYISANGNKYSFLGSFIYPGNTAFGGDPEELKVLMESSGVTTATEYNRYNFTFVRLDSHALSSNVDTVVDNTKILTSSAFSAKVSDNGVPRIISSRGGLATLPDEQTLIGLYIASPKHSGITFKSYSAELY